MTYYINICNIYEYIYYIYMNDICEAEIEVQT